MCDVDACKNNHRSSLVYANKRIGSALSADSLPSQCSILFFDASLREPTFSCFYFFLLSLIFCHFGQCGSVYIDFFPLSLSLFLLYIISIHTYTHKNHGVKRETAGAIKFKISAQVSLADESIAMRVIMKNASGELSATETLEIFFSTREGRAPLYKDTTS